jgi:ATP-dependent DNA helicase RecQ
MAAQLPVDRDALLKVPGVGERKAADLGSTFLDAIATFVSETGAAPTVGPPPPASPSPKSASPGLTAHQTLNLFREGLAPAEIALARNITLRTIEGHLTDLIAAGEDMEIDRLVAPDRQATIKTAFEAIGYEYLKPVMEYLGDGYSYGELQIMRAWLIRH